MKRFEMSLVLFSLVLGSMASGAKAEQRSRPTYVPTLILALTTENGNTYTANIGRIDCSYAYPANHACGPIPTYTGSAARSVTLNGAPQAMPASGSGAHTGVNSTFNLSEVCVYFANLYSPTCSR